MTKQIFIAAALLVFSIFILTGINLGGSGEPALSVTSTTQIDSQPGRESIRNDEEDLSGMFRSGRRSTGRGTFSRSQGRSVGLGSQNATSTATSTALAYDNASDSNYANLPTASVPQGQAPARLAESGQNQPAQIARSASGGTRNRNQAASAVPQPEPKEEKEVEEAGETQGSEKEDEAQDQGNGLITDLSIEGRVLTRDGKTINQMPLELVLLRASAEDRQLFGNQKRQVTSSESGEYAFSNLVSGDYRICTTENSYYEKGCVQAHAPLQTADFALLPINGASVYGVVKDSEGQPLSGVRVSATQQKTSVTTNEKGEYSFEVIVSPNRSYLFYFNKQEYERFRFSLKSDEIGGGIQKDVTMQRLGGNSVPVTVYDDSGSPLKGQRVTIYSSKERSAQSLACSTDESGRCSIKNAAPSDDYKVRVRPKGPYAYKKPITDPITVVAGMSPIAITLEKTGEGTVNAQILSEDRSPQPGIIMSLRSGSQYVGRETSDSGGYVLFEGVPAGSLRFYSDAEPKYTISGAGLKLSKEQYQLDVELIIDRGEMSQSIIVNDATGVVIGGASGTLTWSKDYDGISAQTRHGKSSSKVSRLLDGGIDFSNLGRGKHELRISKDGKSVSQTIDVGVDPQTITVTLE